MNLTRHDERKNDRDQNQLSFDICNENQTAYKLRNIQTSTPNINPLADTTNIENHAETI